LVYNFKGATFATEIKGNWVPALVLESFVLMFFKKRKNELYVRRGLQEIVGRFEGA
jgi:hypothetical protein